MTTIVFRDGILAADTRSTTTGGIKIIMPGEAEKIARATGPALAVGAVGKTSFMARFLAWGADGCQGDAPMPDEDGAYGIVIESLDKLRVYGQGSPLGVGWETAPFQAFGSGAIAAMGALWAGASADRAIEAACRVDPYSGAPVRIIDLRLARPPSKRRGRRA